MAEYQSATIHLSGLGQADPGADSSGHGVTGLGLAAGDDDPVASDADADGGEPDDSDDEPDELAVSVEYPPEKGGCSTAPRGVGGLAWLFSLGLIVGLRREN